MGSHIILFQANPADDAASCSSSIPEGGGSIHYSLSLCA